MLAVLATSECTLSPFDFAKKIITSAVSLSGILRRMEDEKYISRSINPKNRRSIFIHLEKAGCKKYEERRDEIEIHLKNDFRRFRWRIKKRLIASFSVLEEHEEFCVSL